MFDCCNEIRWSFSQSTTPAIPVRELHAYSHSLFLTLTTNPVSQAGFKRIPKLTVSSCTTINHEPYSTFLFAYLRCHCHWLDECSKQPVSSIACPHIICTICILYVLYVPCTIKCFLNGVFKQSFLDSLSLTWLFPWLSTVWREYEARDWLSVAGWASRSNIATPHCLTWG